MKAAEYQAWTANLYNFWKKCQEVERKENAQEVANAELRKMNEKFGEYDEPLAQLAENISGQEAKLSKLQSELDLVLTLEQTQRNEVDGLEKKIRENTESVRRATEEQELARENAEESQKAVRDQTSELTRQTQNSNDGLDADCKLIGRVLAMNSPDRRNASYIFSKNATDDLELKKKNEALDGLNVKMKQLEEQLGAIAEKLNDSTKRKNKIESEKAKIETSIKNFEEEKLEIKSNLNNLKKEKKKLEGHIQNEEEEINEGRKEVLVLQHAAGCFKIGSMILFRNPNLERFVLTSCMEIDQRKFKCTSVTMELLKPLSINPTQQKSYDSPLIGILWCSRDQNM